MAELRIDYDLMNNLADQLYALRDKIDADSKVNYSVANPSDLGPEPHLEHAISEYDGSWKKAFHRAWDAMTTLGNDFNQASQSFFGTDAQIAAQASQMVAGDNGSEWVNQKQQWDEYQYLKGKYYTVWTTDKNGNPVQQRIPLWNGAAPQDPGAAPSDATTPGGDGTNVHSHVGYDPGQAAAIEAEAEWQARKELWDQYNGVKGQTMSVPVVGADGKPVMHDGQPVTRQVPVWVGPPPPDPGPEPAQDPAYKGYNITSTSTDVNNSHFGAPGNSVGYQESTTYGANGGYTTTVHYADGTVDKIVVVAQPDGSATKSEYVNDKLQSQWNGNVKTDQWTKA